MNLYYVNKKKFLLKMATINLTFVRAAILPLIALCLCFS